MFKGEQLQLYKQELWFLSSTRRPIILNICMKFQEDIFNGFHVKHRHDFVTELLLTSSNSKNTYSRVMLVVLCTSSYDAYGNTCMKFYEHILNGFKVVEQT